MSGIARVAYQRGYAVSGSDLKQSKYTRQLSSLGVKIFKGQKAEHIEEVQPDIVVISSAIPQSNPELQCALQNNIQIFHRAQMLAELAKGSCMWAIAGTHGKTTTSSMAASCLEKMQLEPSFLIGGILDGYDTNGNHGKGAYFVCEADESDGSFLYFTPHIVVVTNIEADHLDHYSGIEEIEETFLRFMKSVPESGAVVVCADDERAYTLAMRSEKRVVSYGFSQRASVRLSLLDDKDPNLPLQSQFIASFPDGKEVRVHIDKNPGVHNVLNAAAVLCCAWSSGLELDAAAAALSCFSGVRRRFDFVGNFAGVDVVDDYAHHPTEIAMTLAAAKRLNYASVRVVFQPHRYSRTQLLEREFASCFNDADTLVLMDIYAAGESPIPGVTSKNLIRAVQKDRPHADVAYFPQRQELIAYLVKKCEPGDLVLTMGAGDITALGPMLIEYYQQLQQTPSDYDGAKACGIFF